MKTKDGIRYEERVFSESRQVIVDVLDIAKSKHTVWGLFECDVTDARQLIAEYKERTGKRFSFTGWIVACIAKALDENKRMQAYRKGKDKLIIFDDVDVTLMVERQIKGRPVPTTYLIRAANKKSVLEIHQEIKEAQRVKDESVSTETEKSKSGASKLLKLPGFLRRFVFNRVIRDPFKKKKYYGTIGVTSVGMFGQGTQGGWAIPITPHCMSFALGALGKKPGVVDGEIKIREYLCITVAVDHDLVDGGPGTRFLKKFHTLVESSYGLHELLDEGGDLDDG